MKNTNLLATIVAGLTLLCLGSPAKAQHPCQEEVTQNSLWSLPVIYAQFPDDGQNPPVLSNLPIPPEASPTPDPLDEYYYSGFEPAHYSPSVSLAEDTEDIFTAPTTPYPVP